MDKNSKPQDDRLHVVLGKAYSYYQQAIALANAFVQDWNFIKSSGWMLKVHDKKKALFYLIPLDNMIKISMAIRESEKDEFLADPELASMNDTISNARKYSEGFALQWDILDEESCKSLAIFVQKLIQLRI